MVADGYTECRIDRDMERQEIQQDRETERQSERWRDRGTGRQRWGDGNLETGDMERHMDRVIEIWKDSEEEVQISSDID